MNRNRNFIASILCFVFGWVAVGSTPAQEPYPGWMLYGSTSSRITNLADLNGNILHTWNSLYTAGTSIYLLDDGRILRCGTDPNRPFGGSGVGGILEIIGWDGTVEWTYQASGPDWVQHHDAEVLPNGNILFNAWERYTREEAIAQGRDPMTVSSELWSEVIHEVEPVGTSGGKIVWSWRAWDHLVQDFNPNLPNFGTPSDFPGKIDINYAADGGQDWLHLNSVDYNPELDQIVTSSTQFDEIWIISHAPGDAGEIKYRYGNPAAYGRGMPIEKVLFGQHHPNWIAPGLPGAGNIMIFNNGADTSIPRGYSSADEIIPPLKFDLTYELDPGLPYGPAGPVFTIDQLGDGSTFFSSIMSSAERMPNGNTVVLLGRSGETYEFDSEGNQVWSANTAAFAFRLLRFGTFDSRLEGRIWDAVDGETLNVSEGFLFDGGLTELAESDDTFLEVRRNTGPIVIELKGTSPRNTPDQLTFFLEANHSISASNRVPTIIVTKQIELFNYVSGDFEVVDIQSSTVADDVVQIDIKNDAARFIEAGTNCVEARLTFVKNGLARGFRVKLDHAQWRAAN